MFFETHAKICISNRFQDQVYLVNLLSGLCCLFACRKCWHISPCTAQHHVTTFHCTVAMIVEGDDWRKLQEQQTSWMMFVLVSSLVWADQMMWWKCGEKNWGAVGKLLHWDSVNLREPLNSPVGEICTQLPKKFPYVLPANIGCVL